MKSVSESYAAAGVDVTAGYKAVELMKAHVARTAVPGVLSGLGGFGGLFEPDLTGIRRPVLVSGTDGVGTKLKLAFLMWPVPVPGPCFSWITSPVVKISRKKSPPSWREWRRAVCRPAAL